MEQTTLGEELVLTAPPADIARRSKPHLVQVGNRYLSSDSKWHPELASDYVLANGRGRWLPVAELARTFFGANIPTTKKKVRRRLPPLIARLIDRRNVLLIQEEDAKTRRVTAVKVFDPRSEQDRQGLMYRVERMRQRKELTAARYDKVLLIVAIEETAAASLPG